jgi:hypothetical protein
MSRAAWRTSTYSGNGGNCIEVAPARRVIAVRDSKDPQGPNLVFGPASWAAFTGQVKASVPDK